MGDSQPMKNTITHSNIPTFLGHSADVWNAEVIPGQSIRIWGTYHNHVKGCQTFDRTFKIGDEVEYDSYNLKYTGPILGIGSKSVLIKKSCSKVNCRLDLPRFIWRNWDFDSAKVAAHNSEEMLCI